MTRQQSYSTQQSNIWPITTFGYLSQMDSVILWGNKACYKPPSRGIGSENFFLCSPKPLTITQHKQKLVRTMRNDWLAALKYAELSLWAPASPILLLILLAGILLCLLWVMLMYWDPDIFLLKPDLRRTCDILERTTPLWTWKFLIGQLHGMWSSAVLLYAAKGHLSWQYAICFTYHTVVLFITFFIFACLCFICFSHI